jgi:hypothetical protein
MLISMKSVLLIIRCKFECEDDKCNESKEVVRGCERIMWLENSSSVCWETKKEKEDILGKGDEEDIGELED